jgi:hypothetical protein
MQTSKQCHVLVVSSTWRRVSLPLVLALAYPVFKHSQKSAKKWRNLLIQLCRARMPSNPEQTSLLLQAITAGSDLLPSAAATHHAGAALDNPASSIRFPGVHVLC